MFTPTSSSSRNPSSKRHTQTTTQHIFPLQPSGEFGSSSLPREQEWCTDKSISGLSCSVRLISATKTCTTRPPPRDHHYATALQKQCSIPDMPDLTRATRCVYLAHASEEVSGKYNAKSRRQSKKQRRNRHMVPFHKQRGNRSTTKSYPHRKHPNGYTKASSSSDLASPARTMEAGGSSRQLQELLGSLRQLVAQLLQCEVA